MYLDCFVDCIQLRIPLSLALWSPIQTELYCGIVRVHNGIMVGGSFVDGLQTA